MASSSIRYDGLSNLPHVSFLFQNCLRPTEIFIIVTRRVIRSFCSLNLHAYFFTLCLPPVSIYMCVSPPMVVNFKLASFGINTDDRRSGSNNYV